MDAAGAIIISRRGGCFLLFHAGEQLLSRFKVAWVYYVLYRKVHPIVCMDARTHA